MTDMIKNNKFERTVVTLRGWGERIGKIIRSDDYKYGMDKIKTIGPGQCLQLQYLLRSSDRCSAYAYWFTVFMHREKNMIYLTHKMYNTPVGSKPRTPGTLFSLRF